MKRRLVAAILVMLVSFSTASIYVWKKYINPPWEGEYAYTKGTQAAIYTFPYVFNSYLRWAWGQPAEVVGNDRLPSDAINAFWHARQLTDASYRDGGSPNNDTLYSISWSYLEEEPLIISVPDVGNLSGTDKPRYFTFQLAGFDSDNFGYIGTRTTGNQGGHYAITPKGWPGRLPDDVERLADAPTP